MGAGCTWEYQEYQNRNGRWESLISLDGNDDYVDVDGGILTNVYEFTYGVWIKPDTLTSWDGIMCVRGGESALFRVDDQGTHTNALNFNVDTEQPVTARGPANSISTGVWQHVAATWTTNCVASVYVDGILVTSVTAAANNQLIPTDDLRIGYDDFDSGRKFDGMMDDACVWDVALTQPQLMDIVTNTPPTDNVRDR
jgi:hypothetical protein